MSAALGRAPAGERPRALVTGGAGFVGGNLVDRLVADGWRVVVLDDLSTGRRARVPQEAELAVYDVAVDDVATVVRHASPDVVFHLAAQASVPVSVADPQRDAAVNVEGTRRLLEAAAAQGVRRFVFVSSGGAVYGETRRAASERSRVDPKSPYGRHKLQAERLVAAAGLSYSIARPSNIYGPGQHAGLEGAVVATFIARARERQPLTIDGDGSQTRDFVHVADVVQSLLRLAATPVNGIWNVAAGRRTSVSELADIVERAAGVRLGRTFRASRTGDVHDSALSSAKLAKLGWRPEIPLAAGIRELMLDRPR
jgi:UDP-glucose 4-epimerase